MNNDDTRKGTSNALAAAKVSLQTARMSLGELDRLREAARGPSPGFEVLRGFIGRGYDDVDVQRVLFPLGLRHRTLMGRGSEAASKSTGLRVVLDGQRQIDVIVISAEANDHGASPWTGPVGPGLTAASSRVDVRRALGRGAVVEVDGMREEQFIQAGVVVAFVFADEAMAEVRLRRSP